MPKLRLLPPATIVNTESKIQEVLQHLMNRGGTLAIDTETTGLDKFKDRILYWSMATESARYFLEAKSLYRFDPLFARKDIRWRLANAKFDLHQFATAGVEIAGQCRDIVVQDALVDDTRPHGLKDQSWHRYEVRWGEFKELFLDPTRVAAQLGLDKARYAEFKKLGQQEKLPFVYDIAPEVVVDYASCDAYFTWLLGEDLDTQLGSTELATQLFPEFRTLGDYFDVLEVPLTKALWRMERRGVAVDRDYVKSVDMPMRKGLIELESQISSIVGSDFNPRAADDVGDFLFKTWKVKPLNYTERGAGSTAEKDLSILQLRLRPDSTPAKFIGLLLQHKKLSKLHGTYVKNIDKVIGPDGRVHSSINQTGARTARLSSSDPNMQNIPQRNDPYKLRGMFVASEGNLLLDLDYPQIEFRIAAVLADEQGMLEAFRRNWDIHNANAANAFKLDYDAIVAARDKKDRAKKDKSLSLTDAEKWCCTARDRAKTVGLGTLYGEGAAKIAADIGCSLEEAKESIAKFFAANPNIGDLIGHMHDFAHANGFTHTMLGRMRQLHRINSGMRGLEAQEERQAFNTVVQGSGAEMMKLAILRVDSDPFLQDLGIFPVLTVHDELIAEGAEHVADLGLERMAELMADPYRWGPIQFEYPVPINPDGSAAKRWSEAK